MKKTLKNLLRGLAAALIPLAVTFLGWRLGGGDLATLDHSFARVAYLLLSMAAFFSAPFVAARMKNLSSKGTQHDKGQDKFILITSITSGALMLLSPLTDGAGVAVLPGGEALRWVGLAVYTAGFVLMISAPMYLGKQFSAYVTLQEDHELITTGPLRGVATPPLRRLRVLGFRPASSVRLPARPSGGGDLRSPVPVAHPRRGAPAEPALPGAVALPMPGAPNAWSPYIY